MEAVHTVIEALAARGLDVRSCRVRALRTLGRRPIHCFLLTCFDHREGALVRKVLIGKSYAGRDGPGTFEILKELWEKGFGGDPWLAVPEPIAYVPSLSLLLQERARGRDLHRDLGDPVRSIESARRAARWLARLHSMRVTCAPIVPFSYEEERLARYGRTLGGLFPAHARRIDGIVRRVTSSLATLGASTRVPTHGDFQPRNMHASSDRITVFDFDRFGMAHPARDLGHFVGQCLTMSHVLTGSFREIEPWNTAFLDEYAHRRSGDAAAALSTFVPRTFLEVLYHKLFTYPVSDPSFLATWLEECERWEGVR